MPFYLNVVPFLLAFNAGISHASAPHHGSHGSHGMSHASAPHAGFHVQFPWTSRGPNPEVREELDPYSPFCGMFIGTSGLMSLDANTGEGEIIHNPQRYARSSRTFLSFSGHPGDLVTALYATNRVPRSKDDFPLTILQDVPIQQSGQLCVNVTIPFPTEVNEMGVMYFEARDPKTGKTEYYVRRSNLQGKERMLRHI